MPKASEIAIELRRIATSLEREPDVELHRPMMSFYNDKKQEFIDSVRLLPKPLKKNVSDRRYEVESPHESAIWLRTLVDRGKVCKLIKPAIPAEYDCSPLLSDDEENALEVEA